MQSWLPSTSDWSTIQAFVFGGVGFELLRARAESSSIKIWEERRYELSALGYSFVKERDGTSAFHHWKKVQKNEVDRLRALSFAVSSDFQPPAPAGFNFHDYQRAGIEFAWTQKCVLIGDEMGLGKTAQALGVLNLSAAREGFGFGLIVTLATLKINWEREASRWLTFDHELVIAEGKSPADLGCIFKTSKPKILVINYDLLARWRNLLTSTPWDIYVADEAHLLKNPKSARGEVGLGIPAPRKIFLSGTPLENKPSELFPILHALQPARFPDFFLYAKQYCDAKQKEIPIKGKRVEGRPTHRKVWDFSGCSNLAELQAKLRSSLMIRRLKEEVSKELPKKTRQIIVLPSDIALVGDELGVMKGHIDVMEAMRAAARKAKSLGDRTAFKEAVLRMDEGLTVAFEETAAVRKATAIAKIPMMIQHLKDLVDAGEKVLCFGHHYEVLDAVMEEFGDRAVLLRGDVSTSSGKRQANVDRFQNDESCRICVAGIRAAGTGLNLTAANVVCFLELDWVPGALAQAEDRAHRQGQKRNVLVQYLVLEHSMDMRMATMIVDKMNMADEALDGEAPVEGELETLPALSNPVAEGITSETLAKEGSLISRKRVEAIHAGLKFIARICDFGRSTDSKGFSSIDAPVGHDLAACHRLSPRQAALGLRLLRRYHRQLPTSMITAAEPALELVGRPVQVDFDFALEQSA